MPKYLGNRSLPLIFDISIKTNTVNRNTEKNGDQKMKNINITFSGYGHFKISTTVRGKEYSTVTTNTMAIDRYKDDETPATRGLFYNTRNQAAQALYNEIKTANNLK